MPADAGLTGTDLQAVVTFAGDDNEPVVAKIGLSVVSEENARKNTGNRGEGV